ncbi:uncharacterized protein LOC129764679 [Toxorhynchites rutilus septentrionalis]|uniref:uncharacterized protein LOC129764679 n=1 Tax=Toxorhynchites rutilus septentrionalis TaxID=329112 RepID=UPI002478FA18|nr:uncharacterized protein LOC129764679 [Toxorhynchites rutilus septentrionalis]
MKTVALVFLCFCSAFADVSELLNKPELLAEPIKLDATLPEETPGQDPKCGEALVEEPEPASPVVLLNQAVEVVEAVEALPLALVETDSVQLTASHPDYQAPYEYQTPKIQLDYVAPAEPEVVTEDVVVVELPSVKEEQPLPVQNEYLPPLSVTENLVKRHAKFGRKSQF